VAITELVERQVLRSNARRYGLIPEGAAAGAVRQRDTYYRRSLGISDVVMGAAAVILVLEIIYGPGLRPPVLLAAPALVLLNKAMGLYDRDEHVLHKATLEEGPQLFWVATLATLVLSLGGELWFDRPLHNREVVLLWAVLLVALSLGRVATRSTLGRVLPPERCLVIGDELSACRIARKLAAQSTMNAVTVGYVPFVPGHAAGPGNFLELLDGDAASAPATMNGRAGRASDSVVPLLGSTATLGLVLIENEIQRVIVAPTTSDSEEVLDVIRVIRALGVKVSLLPRLVEVVGHTLIVDDVEGIPLLGIRRRSLSRSSELLKRSLDIAIAVGVMLVGLPLFVVAALAVKIDSRGPLFFYQRRVGRFGRTFKLIKFRTMVPDAEQRKHTLLARNEAEGLFKITDDPRITRVGRLLRRTNLDELPQLVNVLRGDMSLVGPRPLIPDEDANIHGWYRDRLRLKPGMTGHWQVLGASRIPLAEMVKIDHLYVTNWSLWLDVKIMLRTIPYVVRQRGI
jgi:exopolysaccharide biosynthesis polyprenyl glycosylphosphotransferase